MKSDFFLTFPRKTWVFENCANLLHLNIISANFEQNLRIFFFREKFRNFDKISTFFLIFQKKTQMFQNCAHLFILKYQCAKFQQKIFFRKNGLWSSVILNKISEFSKLKSIFFNFFPKKPSNFRKFCTFICSKLPVCQFSAKKKLFGSSSSSPLTLQVSGVVPT